MGKIESNNGKMTLQNVTAKYQCNLTIVQSLHESIKENKSILKIKANLCSWLSLMFKNNSTEATILEV